MDVNPAVFVLHCVKGAFILGEPFPFNFLNDFVPERIM